MPVYRIMDEMPYEELCNWVIYFKSRPVGWREDHRTSLLMRSFGSKQSGEEIFPSLAAVRKSSEKEPEELRLARTFKNSGLFDRFKNVAEANGIKWEVADV